jgi:translation initiation factor 2 beta subunit (eIF-2beta)/eIF-5
MINLQLLRIIMKVRELIQEFVPCEICGNNDLKNFYFHILVDKGSQPYVKCCECEEEFYSTKANNILTGLKESSQVRTRSKITFKNNINISLMTKESVHPLVQVLARI